MSKLTTKLFWVNWLKIFLPFFLVFTFISVLLDAWRPIFGGDFATANEILFSDGKWMRFFGIKLAISFLYALWMTNKNMK